MTPPPADVDALCDRLDKLRADATPGPWMTHPEFPSLVIKDGHDTDLAECWDAPADAALIVAAVNALPTLTVEVRRLRAVEAAALNLAADEFEAEAAYDDAAPDEQYPRRLFAARLRERADNLRLRAALSAQATGGGQ